MLDHGPETVGQRRSVGGDRAAPATAASPPEGRPSLGVRAGRAGRDHLRVAHGHALAAVADGARLRQRPDLLAPAPRRAGRRRLGAPARDAAELARRRGGHRLGSREPGQRERAGQKGGAATGPNPTDSGKRGSKYHPVVDRRGIPLAIEPSAANVHDSIVLEPMIEAIPPIVGPRGRPGRPRSRPAKLHADQAYEYACCRRYLRRRGIAGRIARRGVESSERLGRHRWVVERAQPHYPGNAGIDRRRSGCDHRDRWAAPAGRGDRADSGGRRVAARGRSRAMSDRSIATVPPRLTRGAGVIAGSTCRRPGVSGCSRS